MRMVNQYLEDAQVIELKEISTETGIPMAELIRRAIKVFLTERKEKKLKEKKKTNKEQ